MWRKCIFEPGSCYPTSFDFSYISPFKKSTQPKENIIPEDDVNVTGVEKQGSTLHCLPMSKVYESSVDDILYVHGSHSEPKSCNGPVLRYKDSRLFDHTSRQC